MVKIIAEVANAHEGEPKRAIKIAKDAAYSGADAVKFQIYFGQIYQKIIKVYSFL